MPQTLSISAAFVKSSDRPLPSFIAGRAPFCVDVTVRSGAPASARVAVRARELFSDAAEEMSRPVADIPKQGKKLKLDVWVDLRILEIL